MDELTELLDKMETYEPTKSILDLAREHPHLRGLQQLAAMFAARRASGYWEGAEVWLN